MAQRFVFLPVRIEHLVELRNLVGRLKFMILAAGNLNHSRPKIGFSALYKQTDTRCRCQLDLIGLQELRDPFKIRRQ